MQFGQAQLRDTIGISVETFRHWKRVLPPFSKRKKFTPGDLLAAGVLRRLTDYCGVRAGHLPEISTAIVEVCNASAWTSLQGKILVVDVQKKTCALFESARALPFPDVVIVCPLEGVMAHVQEELSRKRPAVIQHHLRFPLIAVSHGRARRQRG